MINIKKILIGTAAGALMFGAMTSSAFATVGGPTCDVPTDYSTIQAAVNDAGCTTINVAAGTYTEVGQIVINRDLTIIGADKTTTIIKPAQNTGDPSSGDARGWFLIGNPSSTTGTFNMSGVTLDGDDKNICHGVYDYFAGTIQDINVKNIGCGGYYGRGIYLKNNATVRNVRFENIERIGVFIWQGATAAVIDGNTYVGKGAGDHLDYGIELGNGGVATIINNTISSNTGVASSDGSTSAGILATTFFGPGTQATITGNTLTNNTDGIAVGYDANDASVVVANRNNISGNITTGVVSTGPTVNATCNWWGNASGPGPVGPGLGDNVSTNVTFLPWLTSSDLNGSCNGGVLVGPPTLFSECKGDGWKTFNNPTFTKKSKCEKYVKDHMHTIKGNDVTYTANGLKREADLNMSTAEDGSFEYDDAAKGWYNVKVSSVKVDGNLGWFAGRVVKASNPSWVGLWLFGKVEDNSPDKIWGSFTDQATAEAGVQAMSDPADGPFNVTKKNIKVN